MITVEPHRQPWHFGSMAHPSQTLGGSAAFFKQNAAFLNVAKYAVTWIPIHLKSEKPTEKTKVQKKWKGYEGFSDLSSFVGLSQNCQTGRKGSISPFRWHLHPIGSNEIFKRRSGVTSQHRQASGFWKLRTVIFKAVNFTKTKYGVSYLIFI